ncbi:hypothetical protein CP49_08075 [Bradyrhizobium valentinum]|uniref:Copper uptake system-associated protein n=1 Tax=Bradyrhizobium valentinum TaxID=1518501 RepID=A0A0R3LWR4_9BRAD|nr:hypothetical protein CP49_08075 [Bradyrhizobium valentinum]
MKATLRVVSLLVVLFSSGFALAETAGEAEIDTLLHGMFDKPGLTLKVSPVVIAGDFAIAGWTQGEMGGRALLRRKQGAWVLTLCAGDGIKSHDALHQAGVPAQDAILLDANLAVAEAKIDPQRVAMFSRFEGMVTMEGTSDHAHD